MIKLIRNEIIYSSYFFRFPSRLWIPNKRIISLVRENINEHSNETKTSKDLPSRGRKDIQQRISPG